MEKSLVDVIVPVYKVEKYLEKCINSLLNQTFDSYSVILVDDGSPDNCPEICDKYEKLYPEKIRVIHKKNGGLSDARNAGVAASTAPCIVFVDSDDYVSEKYIEDLYIPYKEHNADMVVSSMCREYIIDDGASKKVYPSKNSLLVMDRDTALTELFKEQKFASFAWGKLFSRELVIRYPYPKGKYFEDSFTTYKQVADCKKVIFSPEVNYFYLQRGGSIQHSPFESRHMDLVYSAKEMLEYIKNLNISTTAFRAAEYKFCRAVYITMLHAAQLRKNDFNSFYCSIKTDFKKHLKGVLTYCGSRKEKALFLLLGKSSTMFWLLSKIKHKVKPCAYPKIS